MKMLKNKGIEANLKEDLSMPGGGSLPEAGVKTYVVAIKTAQPEELAKRLRYTQPPVIGRIKDDSFVLDARTIQEREIPLLGKALEQVFFSSEY